MNTLRLIALAALGLVTNACAMATPTDGSEENAGSEELGSVAQATTSACANTIVRKQLSGKIAYGGSTVLENQEGAVNTATAYFKRCTNSFTMAVGDRHYVKTVGANGSSSANPLSIWVERYGTSWAKVMSRSTAGTSTEVLDWSVDVAGTYRVCAAADDAAEGTGADYIRLTSDKSSASACGAVGSAVDFCFGAVGSNCSGVAATSPCSTNADATVTCQASVGSQLHDTCCAHNPGGSNCGGTGNPSAWPSDCSSEYSHAQNDVTTTRQYPKAFDPTAPFYRSNDSRANTTVDKTGDYASWASFATDADRQRATPTASSIKTPVGKALWDVDAQKGWCVNPANYKSYWSLQGNYSVCCDTANGGC